MNTLINFIDSISSIPATEKEKLESIIIDKQIDSGENYIEAGTFPRTMGFVQKGLFRYFYSNDKGDEFTKGFFPENTIVISYSAIIQNRESYFSIQALEKSSIQIVNYSDIYKLFGRESWFHTFLIAMLQKGYCTKEQRERELLLLDAEERYKAFLKNYPGLDKRVKQHYIASFLGITPESLSRVRKKMGILT